MSDRKGLVIGLILGILILLCLCCGAIIFGGGFAMQQFLQDVEFDGDFTYLDDPQSSPTPTAHILETVDVEEFEENISLADETVNILDNEIVPENSPAELAVRLGGVDYVPETLPDENAPYDVGARKEFWVANLDSNTNFKVSATLQYETEHAYFWIGDSVDFRALDLEELAEAFENHIYPTNREFFGSEWTPGIDEDPHIYILYVPGIGSTVAGYFSSSDSSHPLAHEYSNAHEMFVFNADNSPLGNEYTYGVLAHEFQHMIHFYGDRNETSWVNEGFSELATLLNGYDAGGFDYYFMSNPDYQLNNWPNNQGATTANYGAAFLFMAYFLDRMGSETTQNLVSHPENGLHSIDLVLEEINASDPISDQPLSANDLVFDWALANYIQDNTLNDGRYGYHTYTSPPQASDTETIYDCPTTLEPRTVNQYGTDYVRFTCQGEFTLNFQGGLQSTLVPAFPYSGDYAFWSNKGDESDMMMTQKFDFTDVDGPLTFSYYTWYDIEEGWDYIYLLASTDGETWEILRTPSGTDEDPSGNSFGWGYDGLSGGGSTSEWIQEQVDLSQFAGQEVWLRFEYITDAAVHGEGLLLDDLSIPEIGYFTDFEEDDGGWEGDGFVRVSNYLPQTFRVALVYNGTAGTYVEYLTLDDENALSTDISLGGDYDEVTLVVMGTTRYTRQVASYQFEITE